MSVFVEQFLVGEGSIKVAIKDTIDVAGYPTRAGSAALDAVEAASSNAEVVDCLLAAGCQLTGKLTMHELAYGMTGVNSWVGTPINHFYPDYIPGGSSSGSAVVVAEGCVNFSLGTDTGGSIRLPAACCGVFGLKPTFGRVSRKGVMPVDSSLDCVGPFARSAEGLIQAMEIIDSRFQAVTDIPLPSLGYLQTDAEEEICSVVEAFLQRAGVATTAVKLPSMQAAFEAGLTLINAEAWAAYSQYLASGKLGEDVARRLIAARNTSAEDIAKAEVIRELFTKEVDQALLQTPLLVLPTLPTFPMTLQSALAGKQDLNISALVRPFNVSGHPALSMPIQVKAGGPVGLQLVAGKGQDALLCETARLISQLTNQ